MPEDSKNTSSGVLYSSLEDAYKFNGALNVGLKFLFNQSTGTIELYSSFDEWIGNAYSIGSLIELLTKLKNDELA